MKEAFEICIKLNKWDKAAELSERYQLADVENLLANYAEQIAVNKTKNLAAAQLYRKAAKFLQAAKIIFDVYSWLNDEPRVNKKFLQIANDERCNQAPAMRLKKLYVMGGLLVEDFHEQNRMKLAKSKGEDKINVCARIIFPND